MQCIQNRYIMYAQLKVTLRYSIDGYTGLAHLWCSLVLWAMYCFFFNSTQLRKGNCFLRLTIHVLLACLIQTAFSNKVKYLPCDLLENLPAIVHREQTDDALCDYWYHAKVTRLHPLFYTDGWWLGKSLSPSFLTMRAMSHQLWQDTPSPDDSYLSCWCVASPYLGWGGLTPGGGPVEDQWLTMQASFSKYNTQLPRLWICANAEVHVQDIANLCSVMI